MPGKPDASKYAIELAGKKKKIGTTNQHPRADCVSVNVLLRTELGPGERDASCKDLMLLWSDVRFCGDVSCWGEESG